MWCMTRPASTRSRWCGGGSGSGAAANLLCPTDDVHRDPRPGAAAGGADDSGGPLGGRRVVAKTTPPCRRWPATWAWTGTPPGRRSRPRPRSGSASPTGCTNVTALGVDEHIWRPSRVGIDRAVTVMVDLTRDQDGCLHARLLDAVVGRSGTAYEAWLKAQPDGFTARRRAGRTRPVPRLRQRDP